MANSAIGKIIRFERIYNRKKDAKTTYVMAISYYLGYAISGQRDLLHKANFVLSQANFSADLSLSFLRCFIAYEAENFELLEELLGRLRPRRNAMKSHQPTFFAYYLYFDCLLALTQRKDRAANKHLRNLRDLCAGEQVQGADLLLANLSLTFGDFGAAFAHLHRAYKKGDRSPLFFVCLARTFGEARPGGADGKLLLPLVLWALNTGCYIDGIITQNQHLAENMLRRRPKVAEALYTISPLDWILHIIATSRMINNDISERAFYYYKEAEIRQLYFPQLYDFLLRSAHKNGIEDISGYSLAQFLRTETNIPAELLPFVYHLVLKGALGAHHDEIMARLKPEILRFACECLDNRLYGKYYYSMYKFLMDVHVTDVGAAKVARKYLDMADEIIKNLLFMWEIQIFDPNVKRVLIREDYKKDEVVYEPKDGRLRVNMWSPRAKITCFDESMRNIIESKITTMRLIENADLELCRRLFAQGFHTPELLIFLASHHINAANEQLSHEAIAVFDKVRKIGINRAFARLINAALGNHYARQEDFVKAVAYFKDLDDSAINKNYLEQMLKAYINAKDFAHAARLITRNPYDFADKSLFGALKQMSPQIAGLGVKRGLAAAVANMLVRGWFDADLLNIVLEFYAAPLVKWVDLAKSLSNLGIFEPKLHTKILEIAIQTRNSGKNVQDVFVQMAEKAATAPIIADFAHYLSYEILTNGTIPKQPVVNILEEIYITTGDAILGYALAHIYIGGGGLNTEKSREILAKVLNIAAQDNIIFPIFKEIKDKSLILSYIEKNRPFCHRARAGDDVALHFRIGQKGDFIRIPMRYLAFGLYLCHIPHFYGEEIEFYYSQSRAAGSITTAPAKITNNIAHILEKSGDLYYTINNALLYEQMFKYEQVEEIVTAQLAKKAGIRAKIM
ncbi:MAG: DUF5717 family protein [Clostridiales bacterium]|nr:DUF5717 family protein [Clostridiales bacterium]